MSSMDQNTAQMLSGNSEQLRSNYLGDKVLCHVIVWKYSQSIFLIKTALLSNVIQTSYHYNIRFATFKINQISQKLFLN